jgi:hypothetical protein
VLETGSDVTNDRADQLTSIHVSGLLCTVSRVLAIFFNSHGDLSISAARGRARPEVTSPSKVRPRFPISVQTFLV